MHKLRIALAVIAVALVGASGTSARTAVTAAHAAFPQPVPTQTACVDAWNRRALGPRRALAGLTTRQVNLTVENGAGPLPLLRQAVAGGVSKPRRLAEATGACVLSVPIAPRHLLLVVGSWAQGSVVSWRTVPNVLLSGILPLNGHLLADGRLTSE